MAQSVIWTDDTPIRTLAPGTGKTRLSRFWCYAVDPRPYHGPGHPAVFYRYSADRKGERPRGHLDGFSGFLHADAFAGYEALYRADGQNPPRITHVACMAHARRKLFEVFEATKSPIAEEALRRIQDLYAIEADINGRPADQRWTHGRPGASRCSMRSTLGRWPATTALRKDAARQGLAVRAEPMGCVDPLYRRRPSQHRQQFGGAAAARHRRHSQEFSVPGFRSWWRQGRRHLHHR